MCPILDANEEGSKPLFQLSGFGGPVALAFCLPPRSVRVRATSLVHGNVAHMLCATSLLAALEVLRPMSSSTLYPRRALVAGMYGAVATGCFYGFGLYSDALQDQFNLTPSQVSNINTIPYAFGLFSPLLGALARRMGQRLTLIAGGLLISSMQLLMYAVASGWIVVPKPPVTLVVISVMTYFGNALVTACAFSTPVLHYPRLRGEVIALVKSFVGLGGEVIAQLFVLLFGSKTSDHTAFNALLLWAGVTLGCTSLAAFVTPAHPDPNAAEPKRLLRILFWELIALSFFSIGVALLPYGRLHDVLVVPMIALALAPIALAFSPSLGRPATKCAAGSERLFAAAPCDVRTHAASDGPSEFYTATSYATAQSYGLDTTLSSADAEGVGLPKPADQPLLTTAAERRTSGLDGLDDSSSCVDLSSYAAGVSPHGVGSSPHHRSLGSGGIPTSRFGASRSLDGPQRELTADGVDLLAGDPHGSEIFTGNVFETPMPRRLWEMLAAPEAWQLWLTGVVVIGGGNFTVTKLSQIFDACGACVKTADHPTCGLVPRAVTIFNAGNQLGRLTCMVFSNALVRSGRPRPLFPAAIATLMLCAHLIYALAAYLATAGSILQSGLLLVATAASGLSFGAIWPHLVVLASELFGSANLGVNYMFFDGTCAAVGTLAVANFLPRLFDHAEAGGDCIGAQCFGPTHIIIASLCAVGVLTALLAARRSARLYLHISYSMRMAR